MVMPEESTKTMSLQNVAALVVLSGGLGVGGTSIIGGGSPDSESRFASIVDTKIAAREEVIDLKLGAIVDRLERMEGKLDELSETP